MLILPTPDAEGIIKTKEIIFNRSGRLLSDEEASRLLGGLMRYLYLLRRLDDQARDQGNAPQTEIPAVEDSTHQETSAS